MLDALWIWTNQCTQWIYKTQLLGPFQQKSIQGIAIADMCGSVLNKYRAIQAHMKCDIQVGTTIRVVSSNRTLKLSKINRIPMHTQHTHKTHSIKCLPNTTDPKTLISSKTFSKSVNNKVNKWIRPSLWTLVTSTCLLASNSKGSNNSPHRSRSAIKCH